MIKNDLIIIPILLVGVLAGSVLGMGYSPVGSPDEGVLSINETPQNTSNTSTVGKNQSTQLESSTPKTTSTSSSRRTTSRRISSNQQDTNDQTQGQNDDSSQDGNSTS